MNCNEQHDTGMHAEAKSVLRFLEDTKQLAVPVYQRVYSWEKKHCLQLWDDIINAGKSGKEHFAGSIVYVQETTGNTAASLVIDGQQRLTTVMLIIEVLARQMDDQAEAEEWRGACLFTQPRDDGRVCKLKLTNEKDERTFELLLEGGNLPAPLPNSHSKHIASSFRLFEEHIEPSLVDALKDGLGKLKVVEIGLERVRNRPQQVFESMNSTGLTLRRADLIRNFLFMDLREGEQKLRYRKHWQPMENRFGQDDLDEFDAFLRHYLTFKTGSIPRMNEVYDKFKGHADTYKSTDSLMEDVHKFADYYCDMAFGGDRFPAALEKAFADLRKLRVSVAYPFLLRLCSDHYDKKVLTMEGFVEIVNLVESYVFRRSFCNIPAQSMDKTFADLKPLPMIQQPLDIERAEVKPMGEEYYSESIKLSFRDLRGSRKFPSDNEFRRAFQSRGLYQIRSGAYWLRKIESHLAGREAVNLSGLSVEHIMPQTLTPSWREHLGKNWRQIHLRLVHTAGNLTLTGYNQELSNRFFHEKMDLDGGFKESPLELNKGLRKLTRWDAGAISERGKWLADQAVEIWPYPSG